MSGNLTHHFAIILLTCAAVGMLLKKLKLPLVPAYILAGIMLKSELPLFNTRLLDSPERVQTVSELGLLLLMFSIGLEFSFRKLRSLGSAPYLGGIGECLAVGLSVALFAKLFDFSTTTQLALGAIFAFSSTTVIIKTASELRLRSQPYMNQVMGTLIVEDLMAIFAIVALPLLGSDNLLHTLGHMTLVLVTAVVIWWFFGSVITPSVIRSARGAGGKELILLLSVGMALSVGIVFEAFHLSAALGAFLVGSVLADTREIRSIHAVVEPVKHLFVALFFCAFGLQLELGALQGQLGTILAFAAFIFCAKTILVTTFATLAGQPAPLALRMGLTMSQVGEFSLVLAAVGEQAGVLSPDESALVMGVSVISILLSPIEIRYASAFADRIIAIAPHSLLRSLDRYTVAVKALLLFPTRLQASQGKSKANPLKHLAQATQQTYGRLTHSSTSSTLRRLAPFNEFLAEVEVGTLSFVEGKTLLEANLRERALVNVVAVEREEATFVAPDPRLVFYPGDHVLLYGTEQALAAAGHFFASPEDRPDSHQRYHLQDCDLRALEIGPEHLFCDRTLADLRMREAYQCLILAILREGTRIKNPPSHCTIQAGDKLFVVGPKPSLQILPSLSQKMT